MLWLTSAISKDRSVRVRSGGSAVARVGRVGRGKGAGDARERCESVGGLHRER